MEDEYETMTEKKVDYEVIYTGESDWDVKNGKKYKCVAEWYDSKGKLDSISMIDETGQAYIYDVGTFKRA
jgi:hypothetical protein